MGDTTEISWADHTFNPWMGCQKVSPACAHCYAERDMDHRYGKVQWGPNGTRVMTGAANWNKPLKWNRDAQLLGVRKRVFCASLADVFEDWDGPILAGGKSPVILSHGGRASDGTNRMTLDDVRAKLFKLIDATPWLDWLLLTKRPENIRRMWQTPANSPCRDGEGNVSHDFIGEQCRRCDGGHRKNVWLGTSTENQTCADLRIPELAKCRDLASVLFLSCEPLLGTLDLGTWFWSMMTDAGKCAIDWVIAGGESGPDARPSHPDWFRGLRDQCAAAGVAFHFKQWGEWAPRDVVPGGDLGGDFRAGRAEIVKPAGEPDGHFRRGDALMGRVGKKAAGRLLDGVEHNEFPDVVRAPA